jgi:uncharacterized membrane protein YccC
MTPSPEWEARQARIKEQQAQRAKEYKRDRRKKIAAKVVGWTIGVLIALVLATLIFQLIVWNLGIVGLLTALGFSVSKIGFWTAFGGLFAWSAVGSLIHGGSSSGVTTINNLRTKS